LHRALRDCDLGFSWGMEVFLLDDSDMAIGRLRASPVPVVRLSGGHELWPQTRRRAQPTKRSADGAPRGNAQGDQPASHDDALDGHAPDEMNEGDGGDEPPSSGGLEAVLDMGYEAIVDDLDGQAELSVELEGLIDGGEFGDDDYEALESDPPPPCGSEEAQGSAGPVGGPSLGPSPPTPPEPSEAAESQAQRSVASRARGPVNKADARVEVEGGSISFYSSKNVFQAKCENANHGSCVLSRMGARHRASGSSQRAGRPCGFLAAWLAAGEVATKAQHWDVGLMLALSHDDRTVRRNMLAVEPDGDRLLSFERARLASEPEEPLDLVADEYVRVPGV